MRSYFAVMARMAITASRKILQEASSLFIDTDERTL